MPVFEIPDQSAVFSSPAYDRHEQVIFCADAESGLRAIIAIHSTKLGPALGGCRMWPYDNEHEAITDVLRLSRAMSYKNALARLSTGGGKSVIIGDPEGGKSEALFHAFGRYCRRRCRHDRRGYEPNPESNPPCHGLLGARRQQRGPLAGDGLRRLPRPRGGG